MAFVSDNHMYWEFSPFERNPVGCAPDLDFAAVHYLSAVCNEGADAGIFVK